jgi:tripartite-type tricarboxylate transporter receptor subunit TctC
MSNRTHPGRRMALLGGAGLLASPALAQPISRTVRILSGFPPGGQIDAVARL